MIYCDKLCLLKNLDTKTGFLIFSTQVNENKEIMKISYKFSVVLEKDEYGYYAYCPVPPGCQTQGDYLNEVVSNIKQAIERDRTLSRDSLKGRKKCFVTPIAIRK